MIKKLKSGNWLIFAVIILAWVPVITVPFLNDDYQILGFYRSFNAWSLFTPFIQTDATIYYWRPLGNVLHILNLMIFGWQPAPFRITGLILYTICAYIFYYFLKENGIKKEYAIGGTILFSLLPSHEYNVAWIADQWELIATIFLMLAFIYYKKKRPLFFLFFFLSLLSKESSFTGFFIPLLFMIKMKDNTNNRNYYLDTALALVLLVGVQIYRYLIIGGSSFSSPNLVSTGPIGWIINFFLYIPSAFVSPELMEMIISNKVLLIIVSLLLLSIIFYSVQLFRRLNDGERKIFYTGLLWFLIFIIPASLRFMRWYVFTASAGLMLSVIVLSSAVEKKKVLIVIASVLTLILIVNSNVLMSKWNISGNKMKEITAGFSNVTLPDTVILFCTPEKINNVPVMKLAINEIVQKGTGKRNITALSPLRGEYYSNDPKVTVERNDSVIIFNVINGRFKSSEQSASSFVKEETFSYNIDGFYIEVRNGIKGTSSSSAKVFVPIDKRGSTSLYYDGISFRSF